MKRRIEMNKKLHRSSATRETEMISATIQKKRRRKKPSGRVRSKLLGFFLHRHRQRGKNETRCTSTSFLRIFVPGDAPAVEEAG